MEIKYLYNQDFLEFDNKINSYVEEVTFNGKSKEPDTIYFIEYEDCFTTCDMNPELFRNKSIHTLPEPLYQVDRGGNVTYHGKGQYAIHFLVHLGDNKIKLLDFIKVVLKSIAFEVNQVLNPKYIVDTKDFQGIYIKEKGTDDIVCKVGFMGLKVLHGIVFYGISVNFNVNLQNFNSILPCGSSEIPAGNIKDYCVNSTDKDKFFKNIEVTLNESLEQLKTKSKGVSE